MPLPLFQRLMAGYLVFMLVLVAVGGFVWVQLNRLNVIIQKVAHVDSEIIRLGETLTDTTASLVRFEKRYLVTRDEAFYRRFEEIRLTHKNIQDRLRHLARAEDLARQVAPIGRLSHAYFSRVEWEHARAAGRDVSAEGAEATLTAELIDALRQHLQLLINRARLARDAKIALSSRISVNVVRTSVAAVLIGVAISLLVSFGNARSINRSIKRLQRKTREVAAGRFTPLPPIEAPPEIASLSRDFDVMCLRLGELNAMKEDFIRHVSHELRTPLTAIKEASSLLQEDRFRREPEHQRQLLTIVKDECDRLIASVNRMLDLSRMEAGMMDYLIAPMDFLEILRASVLKLAPIAISRDIALEIKPVENLPAVAADSERIHQVLENLIGNALKFSAAGGAVRIEVSVAQDNGDEMLVRVVDTGCGIPADQLDNIFDKFRRIDVGHETGRGTGLGLSIAKHIVAAHGGKLWAESRLGQGSVFCFTLPLA
ncbi:MAG: ATP-binding protein [Desulfobacterales bacterium]|nr:ATP-binding protein [Desulfobacterales bacterium]MDJ0854155.1 ATP-binding protein [Desulfobacterales bacterium]MDJ0886018.1 ATP-binding protein [Desulfobacterales bacterium]MDJ0989302.1 ATP-binding protein [Desulfobacterales bacterium]